MTGEEALFLVWIFLGLIFLGFAIRYTYRQKMMKRYIEFVESMAKAYRMMKTIYWVDHIDWKHTDWQEHLFILKNFKEASDETREKQ